MFGSGSNLCFGIYGHGNESNRGNENHYHTTYDSTFSLCCFYYWPISVCMYDYLRLLESHFLFPYILPYKGQSCSQNYFGFQGEKNGKSQLYLPQFKDNFLPLLIKCWKIPGTSVGDPEPHVFGPPGSGSGSISQRCGSGSFPFLN